jgi:2'-5' RNA ligase
MAEQRRGQLIRAFIALQLGENNLPTATSAGNALAAGPQGDAIRWVRPGNLHVTLRFLGNLREELLKPLHQAVGRAVDATPAFDLAVGPIGLFPGHRRPRIVAAALEPEQPVIRLAAVVDDGLDAAGIPKEDRAFRAHLTLGRIKRNAPRSLAGLTARIERWNDENTAPATPDRITQVVLFRSELKPDGPVYSVLWNVALAGA